MANDKDFLLKNAVEVGGSTKVTLGTVTANNVDLSTGNYFADTPSGTSTYTFSNAGDVQSFQLEVTGGTEEAAQNFSTTLYTGTGAAQTITNGIDLAGDGGLIWFKARSGTYGTSQHALFDTERGVLEGLASSSTAAEATEAGSLTAFNSDGFDLGSWGGVNGSGSDYVSWAFKKEPSFFDVVTYTGDGTGARTISHNLGTTVGSLIIKKYSTAGQDWFVYHRSAGGADYVGFLNETLAFSNPSYNINVFNNTAPTDSVFSVGSYTNQSSETYVAYIFAHDDAADGLIQCGSYTGTGAAGLEVDLGWEPQWVMIKKTNGDTTWHLFDNMRGMGNTERVQIYPNTSEAEFRTTAQAGCIATATGFTFGSSNSGYNSSSDTFIYIAIRAASDPDITWPVSIEWSGGTAPSSPAVGETDVYTFITDDGGTSYVGIQSADNLS